MGRPRRDLSGRRFGKLTVLEYVLTEQGVGKWKCRCDCGAITYKNTGHLNAGAVSCGCTQRRDLTGRRFGRLTALQPTGGRSSNSVQWECRCDCGKLLLVRATSLTSGHTTSCGCVKRDMDDRRDFKQILTYTDDTCIEFARSIGTPRTTTSRDTGVRGVIRRGDKYQAQLVFRKKRYYLGLFSSLEDAIAARRRAEERVEEYLDGSDHALELLAREA